MNSKHLTEGSKQPSLTRGKLRLYSMKFCPYVHRVRLVLDAKKIPYDMVNINLQKKPEWYFEKNTLGKVPALEVEPDVVICDSLVIGDYLDEKYPQVRLNSNDPLQKAKDRNLIDQFNIITQAMHKEIFGGVRLGLAEEKLVIDALNLFESLLAERGKYFGGQKPGMIDYMVWPWAERAILLKLVGSPFSVRKEDYKRLLEWKLLMAEDPAVKKNYLAPLIHAKYVQSYRSGTPDYDLVA